MTSFFTETVLGELAPVTWYETPEAVIPDEPESEENSIFVTVAFANTARFERGGTASMYAERA